MGNIIENHLSLRGKPEEVREFFDSARYKQRTFSFEAFVPMPDSAREYINYWRTNNWGTISDATRVRIEGEKVVFQTQWTPPSPVLVAMSQNFPNIRFFNEWIEEFFASAGTLSLVGGNIIEEQREDSSVWDNCNPDSLIHKLNAKLELEWYSEYLQEVAEDTDVITLKKTYRFYLQLLEAERCKS